MLAMTVDKMNITNKKTNYVNTESDKSEARTLKRLDLGDILVHVYSALLWTGSQFALKPKNFVFVFQGSICNFIIDIRTTDCKN